MSIATPFPDRSHRLAHGSRWRWRRAYRSCRRTRSLRESTAKLAAGLVGSASNDIESAPQRNGSRTLPKHFGSINFGELHEPSGILKFWCPPPAAECLTLRGAAEEVGIGETRCAYAGRHLGNGVRGPSLGIDAFLSPPPRWAGPTQPEKSGHIVEDRRASPWPKLARVGFGLNEERKVLPLPQHVSQTRQDARREQRAKERQREGIRPCV
jgi:hypothetical protein